MNLPWPEWFFWEVPVTLTGWGLIVVATILLIWGVALIVSAPRRLSFPYALGWFMISDCLIYALFGIIILSRPGGMEVWKQGFVFLVSLTAVVAFVFWAREKVGNGEGV